MAHNMAANSYLAFLVEEDSGRQSQVRSYRSYYEGDPPTELTDRQAQFLNVDHDKQFGANVCAPIVDALKERLQVTGFAAHAAAGEEDKGGEALADVLDTWWQQNRMDGVQEFVHQASLRDAVSFVIIGHDPEEDRPTFHHDFAFDGTNGVKAHLRPGTYNELAFASKRWLVHESSKRGSKRRLNLYFPNRIEKWVTATPGSAQFSEVGWKPFEAEGLELVELVDADGRPYIASVAWWTDTGKPEGKPLGVPVIPFRNRDDGTGKGLSEIDNAIPLQDAINKNLLDQIAAADMTGWQMYWTTGKQPVGGYKLYPGAMLPVTAQDDSSTDKAQIGVLPAGDLSQLIAQGNNLIALLSGISGTPQSRFTPAAIRPSGETQKQEETPLLAKVKGLQKSFGNSWEDMQKMGLKVQAAFGKKAVPDVEGLLISTQWADVEVRNEKEHVEAIAMKVEKLSVPVNQGWKELGYSADERKVFMKEFLRTQSDAVLTAARQNGREPERNEDESERTSTASDADGEAPRNSGGRTN